MQDIWFRPWGWTYRPTSWQGVIVILLAIAFCTQVFMAIDRHSHSASDTLYGVFPYFVCTFLLLNWLASNTSGALPSAAVDPRHPENDASAAPRGSTHR